MLLRVPFFDLKSQYALFQKEIDQAIAAVFSQGQFIGSESVRSFEVNFARKLGVNHCLGVGNGTDALFVSLKTLGIGAGDEVITPAWSWISSAETITMTGATPVFADVDGYFTISVESIAGKITKRTKAVIAVHLYGQTADMAAIVKFCKTHGLFLIEDCAQAHFSSIDQSYAGCWGDIAAFSFYPTKNLGAYGDGGAVVTNDSVLAERTRRFANHGGLSKDDHTIEGMNSRLDSIQAAVLNVKLKYIEAWNGQRVENARLYMELLSEVFQLTLPSTREKSVHTFHLYVIRAQARDQLKFYLLEKGIETQIHYPKPLPFEPAYKYLNQIESDFPMAAKLQHEVLSLPIYPELGRTHIEYVAGHIKNFYHEHGH
jgi:dTDP-4-amino-4,6-dideoxygalactose transaminase